MTETLTLFEHEAREFHWTPRDLALLERLRQQIGTDVLRPTFQRGKPVLVATEQVGVVRLGDRLVQILPKIYRTVESASRREVERDATRNLLHLLSYSEKLTIREHALAPLLSSDADWFEILTNLFAIHLTEEWQRGPYRTYFPVDEDTPFLKGKWRIATQVRRPERKQVFSVTYDDFGANNPLNQVFRFVVERLWHLSRGSDSRRLLGTLRQWMEEVTLLPVVTAGVTTRSLLSRLNQRFEPLLNLARLFLDGGSLQLLAGETNTFAFVFDMNQLFESFITSFIRSHRADVLPTALEACDILPQTRGASRCLARIGDRRVFRLEPDLAFYADGKFSLLLDAKYKRLDPSPTSIGVSQGDVYQMHAYAHRYDCARVLLLYPQTAEHSEPLKATFTLEDGDQQIDVRTVDIRVDLGKSSGRHQLVNELKSILAGGTAT